MCYARAVAANPYAPPEASLLPPPAARAGLSGLTWAYGALTGAMVLAVGLTWVLPWSPAVDPLWTLLPRVDMGVLVARLLLGLGWLHACWRDLPDEHRGGLSPLRAVLYLFVPFFNLIWLFDVHQRLCRGYDVALMAAGGQPAAPRVLAAVAATLHLASGFLPLLGDPAITYLSYTASGLAWGVYMVAIDRVRGVVRGARPDLRIEG